MKEVLKVGGMTCQHCVNAVTRAIKRLDPAASVDVDLKSGQVSVDGALARDAVQRAVEGAGYSVAG